MTLRISSIPTSGLRDVSLLEFGAEGLEHKNSNRVVVWAMNLDIRQDNGEPNPATVPWRTGTVCHDNSRVHNFVSFGAIEDILLAQ